MYSTLSGTPPGQEPLETESHTDNADMLQGMKIMFNRSFFFFIVYFIFYIGLEAAMLDAQKMLSCATRRPKVNGIGGDQPLSLSSSTDGEVGMHPVNSIPNKAVNNVTKRLDDLVSKGLSLHIVHFLLHFHDFSNSILYFRSAVKKW